MASGLLYAHMHLAPHRSILFQAGCSSWRQTNVHQSIGDNLAYG